MAEYWGPGESPVWRSRGRLYFAGLNISDSLRQALLDWQSEAYPHSGSEADDRSEDEWWRDGERLAERLAAETGLPVDLVE